MDENTISRFVVEFCLSLHRQYGPGLFESVYEEIFCYELGNAGISYTRQQAIPVIHGEIRLEIGFRADVIIENKVLIEFKSVKELEDVHYKQVQTYLKLTGLKLGMLINFNVPLIKDGIHRIVNKL